MKIIGITGGIGSGKSQILEYLHDEYGATICRADDISKKLQKKNQECYQEIVDTFGEEILGTNKEIDRNALSSIVFSDENKLNVLNNIMHPAVKDKVRDIIRKEKKKNTNFFFLEAALLIEDHYEEICDELWYIYAVDEVRIQRLKFSRGYTQEKADNIMKTQAPKEEFFNACDRVIDNSKTFLETCYQLDAIMREI
ncbi:MAG: dephospho-CoA kinase [Suipraeoptans sp.]